LIKLIKNNSFVQGTILYTIIDIISKAIPFLLLPIVTRFLNTNDFGILTNFNVVLQIATVLCGFSTYSFLSVGFFKFKKDLSQYYSNLNYLIVIMIIVLLLSVLLFHNFFDLSLNIGLQFQIYGVLSGGAIAIFTLYSTFLRMDNKIITFGVLQILNSLLLAGFAIFFVVIFKWNWEGRALSFLLGNIFTVLFILFLFQKSNLKIEKFDSKKIKEIFNFGLPLVPHSLSFWFKSGMDKIIITSLLSLSANGIYSIALTLASLVGVFTTAFFGAYSPILYKNLTDIEISTDKDEIERIKYKLVKYTIGYLIILAFVCLISFFIMKSLIPIFFSGDYVKSVDYLPLIFCTLFFDGIYSIMSGYVFFKKKTKTLGFITFSSSILQMFLTYIFVKQFGLIGAPYSSVLVAALTALLIFMVSQSIYKLNWYKIFNV